MNVGTCFVGVCCSVQGLSSLLPSLQQHAGVRGAAVCFHARLPGSRRLGQCIQGECPACCPLLTLVELYNWCSCTEIFSTVYLSVASKQLDQWANATQDGQIDCCNTVNWPCLASLSDCCASGSFVTLMSHLCRTAACAWLQLSSLQLPHVQNTGM